MKLRWRILTDEELRYGDGHCSLPVVFSDRGPVICVLEYLATGQTVKDFWERVEMVRCGPYTPDGDCVK
jgi:hypothetical protein